MFEIGGAVPWSVPPSWAQPVRERLAWLTRVPPGGGIGKARLRAAPRRGLSFQVVSWPDERALLDALRFDHAGREWELPIWPDVQLLGSHLPQGTDFIPCHTDGRDFVPGGRALLWRAADQWEVVPVEDVSPSGLVLGGTTGNAWAADARVYPVRRGRLVSAPVQTARNDHVASYRVDFDITEPCEFPVAAPSSTYRGLPVLEWRSDWGEDPTSVVNRTLELVDAQTGPVAVFDVYGRPFPEQDHRWLLFGRAEHTAWRSLMYGLAGRYATLWVPTYMQDLRLVDDIGSAVTALTVRASAYSVFGRQQPNRRDIRIELNDGTVFYRRILDSAASGDTEVLTIDSALGHSVAVGQVRAISFMFAAQLADDTVTLDHVTDADGVARATTRWQAVAYDG